MELMKVLERSRVISGSHDLHQRPAGFGGLHFQRPGGLINIEKHDILSQLKRLYTE
jgi:hypothetical protein